LIGQLGQLFYLLVVAGLDKLDEGTIPSWLTIEPIVPGVVRRNRMVLEEIPINPGIIRFLNNRGLSILA